MKVVIIGIDGMDRALLNKYGNRLPTFDALLKTNPNFMLDSVYPPDSITAWSSIFSGLNPAEHGQVFFVDPCDERTFIESKNSEYSGAQFLKGKTFWDTASKYGKKVCILFPLLGYPVWPVNGILAGRVHCSKNVKKTPPQIFPQNHLSGYDLSKLNTLKGYPVKGKIPQFLKAAKDTILQELDFAMKNLQIDNWDLFFIYSTAADTIQHSMWKYYDENDPVYAENPYKESILEIYKLYDQFIDTILNNIDSDTIMMVFSDHGTGRRPTQLYNINEYLRNKGYINLRATNIRSPIPYNMLEQVKLELQKFVIKYKLDSAIIKVLPLFPWWRKVYNQISALDWPNAKAYAIDLSGINVYTYAGIKINKQNLTNSSYDELRGLLIEDLINASDSISGEKYFKWILPREKLYQGKYIAKYPDIVFELDNNYGAGLTVSSTEKRLADTHEIVSGGHRKDGAVFLIAGNTSRSIVKTELTLMDIYPSILDALGLPMSPDIEGNSIFGD